MVYPKDSIYCFKIGPFCAFRSVISKLFLKEELTAKYEAAKNELDQKMEEWAELSE